MANQKYLVGLGGNFAIGLRRACNGEGASSDAEMVLEVITTLEKVRTGVDLSKLMQLLENPLQKPGVTPEPELVTIKTL